jgi:hypothetical protein
MPEGIDGALGSWGSLGAFTGLVILVVTSIIRGWLKPKASVDELVAQLQKRLDDRDALIAEQRKTIEAMDKRNDLLSEQVTRLVEVGHTSNAALQALPRIGGQ